MCEQATHSGDAPKVLELAHKYPWVYAVPSASIRRACWPRRIAVRKAPPLLFRYTAATGPQMRSLAPYYEDPKVAVGECVTGLPLARAQGCPAGAV